MGRPRPWKKYPRRPRPWRKWQTRRRLEEKAAKVSLVLRALRIGDPSRLKMWLRGRLVVRSSSWGDY